MEPEPSSSSAHARVEAWRERGKSSKGMDSNIKATYVLLAFFIIVFSSCDLCQAGKPARGCLRWYGKWRNRKRRKQGEKFTLFVNTTVSELNSFETLQQINYFWL